MLYLASSANNTETFLKVALSTVTITKNLYAKFHSSCLHVNNVLISKERYSLTCIKRSHLEQGKDGLLRQVTS